MLHKFEYKEGWVQWNDKYRNVTIIPAFADIDDTTLDVDAVGTLIAALQRVDKIWQERKPYGGGEDEEC